MPVHNSDRSTSKEIPEVVVKRLPIYRRYLAELANREVERITSPELAAKMGITASQLRQDLSWFGSFGQQGYGYRVSDLLKFFNQILGLNQEIHMAMVGAGNLGRAIASYPNLEERGFQIQAIFDNNQAIIGTSINGIKIHSITELPEYLKKQIIQIGVITTPVEVAQEIADMFVTNGIKGIWNFAPLKLKVPQDVVVEHVHISESLLMLAFKLKQAQNIR